MGFVLGGILSGLGQGVNNAYNIHREDALEKIRQKAQADQIARQQQASDDELYLKYGGQHGTAPIDSGSVFAGQSLPSVGSMDPSHADALEKISSLTKPVDVTQGTPFGAPAPRQSSLAQIPSQMPQGSRYSQATPNLYIDKQSPAYLKEQRETASEGLKDDYTRAQIKETTAQALERIRNLGKPIKPNYSQPIIGPNGEVSLIDLNNPEHPIKVPGIQGKVEKMGGGSHESKWQVLQTEGGVFQVNPETGETRPVMLPNGGQAQKPLASSTIQNIATNKATVQTIDSAIKQLKRHPSATGLNRGWNDQIDQRLDKDGVETRALIANVGSQVLHDRSGAAVTISEFPRLAPFVPSIHDRPDKARQKLLLLRRAIATETQGLGGDIPEFVDDDMQSATPASSTEQQAHYDAAAAALKAKGIDPVSKLGPRP